MIKIMFVCHGNICRSPMAEFVMKKIVKDNNMEDMFYIESSATSAEEIGNPVYPPARKILAEHGITCNGKFARQMTFADYQNFDCIIAMDYNNLRNIDRIIGSDTDNKVHLLMFYTGRERSVSDPWYTRDFQTAYNDISEGCNALFSYIINTYNID